MFLEKCQFQDHENSKLIAFSGNPTHKTICSYWNIIEKNLFSDPRKTESKEN